MRMLLSVIAFTTALLSVEARAEDYVFTLPVRIENMRNMESADATCGVEGLRRLPAGAGYTYVPIPLIDGAYNGTLTIRVTLPVGFTRADFPRWACGIIYRWRRPAGASAGYGSGEQNLLYATETGQTVASSVLRTEGAFPR
ncbi:hypothetical protein [Terricaulis silvestris]|uniref:Uncharacterized protein n=1 Tax=Terricaulis silvestris TaxID=2686094 RepID=A0A6I6MMJ0_9CAUL|nr:hypothetical protein [Terricaulis silvestris]QGZ96705.1 hypothetical protein DSM104635_03566 [Terricaulis silvestris]